MPKPEECPRCGSRHPHLHPEALAALQDEPWQPIEKFPRDGDAYLATDNRVLGGFPQVVYWHEERLHVPDADISYSHGFFTHWKRVDEPPPPNEQRATNIPRTGDRG